MIDDMQTKRMRYVAFWRYRKRYDAQQERAGLWPGQYPLPKFPDDLRDLTCGARTRKGTPCKRHDLYDNGRCRLHGGCSTGPRTEAGKQQSRINGKKGGRPRKNLTPCDPSKSLSQTD